MSACIYCGTKENLEAQLTITLDDGKKVTVSVCKEHAEDATIRTAKQKYMERQGEIDALMEKAKALGLELAIGAPSASGLVMVTQKPIARQANEAAMRGQSLNPAIAAEDDPEMIDAEILERRERGVVSSGGMAGNTMVEGHQSLDMSEIKEQIGTDVLRGKVKVEVIEKQSGGVVALPVKKVNGLGTTQIRVVQTTDQEMQRRFKTIAEQSKSPFGWDRMRHLGKEGIEIINCPICKGEGVARNAGKEVTCPKCKGKGMLN